MGPRSLSAALVEAETAYLEAMIRHEAERSRASYEVMAARGHLLEVLEMAEIWWEENQREEAANQSPLTHMEKWRGVPR